MGLLPQLRSAGLRISARGDQLVVGPKTALTDQLRAVIRDRKTDILRELAAEAGCAPEALIAAREAAPLPDFRAALILGRLHICCNCSHFAFGADPAGLGHCRRFSSETAPFVPFWCAGFESTRRAVAPDYLPDLDGARARAKEYAK